MGGFRWTASVGLKDIVPSDGSFDGSSVLKILREIDFCRVNPRLVTLGSYPLQYARNLHPREQRVSKVLSKG